MEKVLALIAHDAKKDEMVAFIKAQNRISRFCPNRYHGYRAADTRKNRFASTTVAKRAAKRQPTNWRSGC